MRSSTPLAVPVVHACLGERFTGTAVHYLTCGVLASLVVLSVIFRRYRWLRLVTILIMLGGAGVAWVGVQTSARIATERSHAAAKGPGDPFVEGAIAARDAALQMKVLFWAVVLGLAVLAIVPRETRE
jgi:hypothetical protein